MKSFCSKGFACLRGFGEDAHIARDLVVKFRSVFQHEAVARGIPRNILADRDVVSVVNNIAALQAVVHRVAVYNTLRRTAQETAENHAGRSTGQCCARNCIKKLHNKACN